VRKGRITFDVGVLGPEKIAPFELRVEISRDGRLVREFQSPRFAAADAANGRFRFAADWKPDRLWDLHHPEYVYSLRISLLNEPGDVLDTAFDARLGCREFWIDGRDFYLNGTRIFLSAVPLDNAQVSAALASYEGARETLRRLKSFGINFVYTHNYDCEPGSYLSFDEVLRAAADVGMLVALTQPHFSHYDWRAPGADAKNGYAQHAAFFVRVAQNHPSVVCYAMSHNATGYDEDMNPDLIDGLHDPRERWAANNAKLALRAEAIVRGLDPARIVYHHASGNLGTMHTINFYPNFAPVQELSDWFEHWSTAGVKPVFTCEYGAPFTWDWAMYRGWYKGQRSFGSARVPWEFCLAEWNAQFLGDRAYRITEMEKANLRWEAAQFRAGRLWNRWDYPHELGTREFQDRNAVMATYLADNWRAFRTWGVSAISPWEYGNYWSPRTGLNRRRQPLGVDWEHLQRPGFSPDYIDQQYERFDLAFEPSDWVPNAAGKALIRNNQPLLAYIGGKPSRVTSKDHIFRPGETVEKQIIVINNSRETVGCTCEWKLDLPSGALMGSKQVTIATGQQERVAASLPLPASVAPSTYDLRMSARFSTGETQDDSFAIDVLASQLDAPRARIALFDPKGETRALLDNLGIRTQSVDASADLSAFDALVVGKAALTLDGPAPRIDRVRDGLKVLIFEQSAEVLERRLGFRVVEYGSRQVFPRVPGHPLVQGVGVDHLRDWRGAATLLPPRLQYTLRPAHGPTVSWCGIPVSRVWRRGNQGNVASVLVEKPARGDFLPIVDCGFGLQYSPLLQYREGRGMILVCQLDVTGRTEPEPAAERLVTNMIAHVAGWKPAPSFTALYAGDEDGFRHLTAAGVNVSSFGGALPTRGQVLVVGPNAGEKLEKMASELAGWLKGGGRLLAIGLDEPAARSLLPVPVRMERKEHIGTYFEALDARSPFAGVGPADLHDRDARTRPLLAGGATIVGDGVLGNTGQGRVAFLQIVPWEYDRQGTPNVKRTFRRASFVVSRMLANMEVTSTTPIVERFAAPVADPGKERRWESGLYLDQPEEWDDPYRFFRW
jgi:hypothetical protein